MFKSNHLPTNRQTLNSIVPTSPTADKKLITILRSSKQQDYTTISNFALQDKRLSFKARGVLMYLLSKPDDWTINISEVIEASPQSKRAVQSAFKELRALGYANLAWIKDGRNKMRSQYFISELPLKEWAMTEGLATNPSQKEQIAPFQAAFTREYTASEFLAKAKTLFLGQYEQRFGAKFSFDRRHTKAIKNLLLAIVGSVDEHFEGKATNEQILKGFQNLLAKAVTKCKQAEKFTPSYILHILHTLRSKRPILR